MTVRAIVCIDDDPTILTSLGEQLSRRFSKAYDIELTTSGAEALSLCAQIAADGIEIALIISDQIMPGMSGDDVLIQLHAQYPQALKILLTGQANADAVGNVVNVGALYRYIAKPWDEVDLMLTVKEALQSYTQERQLVETNEALSKMNKKLESSLSLLLATLEATADGILVLDTSGKVVSFNQKFVEMWSIPEAVPMGQESGWVLDMLFDQLQDRDRFAAQLSDKTAAGNPDRQGSLALNNGKIFEFYSQPQRLEDNVVGCVWSFRDVTEHHRATALIQHQAFHDPLTELPNRLFFDQRLSAALACAQQEQRMLAVMFLDLDRFKLINDTLGHAIGDQLLRSVVHRLKSVTREGDMIARWGGDEFVLLLSEINCREDTTAIAERILATLKPAFELEDQAIHVTSSIGIAVYPQDGDQADILLKNADAALYQVKGQGRNDYQHYTVTLNAQASEWLALENDLHRALEREEFVVYYQPQVSLDTGTIVQMEALVRWQHPELGLVPPNVFIPLAEENGLIVPLGEWVLQTACAQTKVWQQMRLPLLSVAVNLSGRQFQHRNLVQTIEQVLTQTQLDARFLELEITETIAMQDIDAVKTTLQKLHQIGVQIAMDDFGTGYSCLSYLKQLPFHTLKIDSSFIRDLIDNPLDTAIVEAIINLGRGLNLKVVAEGVETDTLKEVLKTLQCYHMQGYFFSPPLPVDAATRLLRKSCSQLEPVPLKQPVLYSA
jgi:diguanylate cyclase (GGDEF)-like protein